MQNKDVTSGESRAAGIERNEGGPINKIPVGVDNKQSPPSFDKPKQ